MVDKNKLGLQLEELLEVARDRIEDGDYRASMLHCRRALETILHSIEEDMNGVSPLRNPPNTKWITSFKGYLGIDRGKWKEWKLLFEVANSTNPWLHENPNHDEDINAEKVGKTITNLCTIAKGIFGISLQVGQEEPPLLSEFERKLFDLKDSSDISESAQKFLNSIPEGVERDAWATYMQEHPDIEIEPSKPGEAELVMKIFHNWMDILNEIYDLKLEMKLVPFGEEIAEIFENRDNSDLPYWKQDSHINLKYAFFLSGMTYLFPDSLHYICKEFVNPNAKWGWDLYRDSTPEEIVSEITDKGTNPWWMGWLDMRLVPDGEDEVIVQLFPRYEYFPPEDYDFEELRRVGVSGILKQAFSIRGADKLRPMQLSNALAILECDVEWLIGTKDSSPEERLEGIPENCMKWLDWEVVEFEDGEEILLSLKQQKDSSEE